MTGIGHNLPPHDAYLANAEDLLELASNTFEGGEVDSDEKERAIDDLLNQARQGRMDADKARKAEKQPHLDASKAVDANWRLSIAKFQAIETDAKRLLTPYREAKLKAKQEAEKKAREEAAARVEAARSKLKEPEALQARVDAEEELKQARKLEAAANRSERAPTGLRTRKVPVVNDHRAALKWIMANDQNALSEFIEQYAQRNAINRPMDGVEVREEKRAA